jgi:hypothetical protein
LSKLSCRSETRPTTKKDQAWKQQITPNLVIPKDSIQECTKKHQKKKKKNRWTPLLQIEIQNGVKVRRILAASIAGSKLSM